MAIVPNDLLWPIFINLNQGDMVRVKRCCKKWRMIIKVMVEDTMPSNIGMGYAAKNALHLYLGLLGSPQTVEENQYIVHNASNSGDKDMVLGWLKSMPNFKYNPHTITYGLYATKCSEWMKELDMEESILATISGSSYSGQAEIFLAKVQELKTKPENRYFEITLEEAIHIAIDEGNYNIISTIVVDLDLKDYVYKYGLIHTINKCLDEITKKLVEIIGDPIPKLIETLCGTTLPYANDRYIQNIIIYFLRMGIVSKEDLEVLIYNAISNDRKQLLQNRLDELNAKN